MTILRRMARGHPGASSGERAAHDILSNLSAGLPVDFFDAFSRLDGAGRTAVVQLLIDLATGKTGLIELR